LALITTSSTLPYLHIIHPKFILGFLKKKHTNTSKEISTLTTYKMQMAAKKNNF
jgi:hypothetical protein